MDQKVIDGLTEYLKKAWEELQDRPDQYVVAYFKVADESLIGYHASTFCQVTDDILKGKRYAGEDPYPQLTTISKNIKDVLNEEKHTGVFAEILGDIKNTHFYGLKPEDIYMDAVYLSEGTPKQSFRYQIVTP